MYRLFGGLCATLAPLKAMFLERESVADARDRRRDRRLQVHERVEIAGITDGIWSTASVIDCSNNGLGLYSARQIAPGALVLVHWSSGYFAGMVRNAVSAGDVWRIGIELEELKTHDAMLLQLKRASLL